MFWTFAKIRGVPCRIHATSLLVFPFIALALGGDYLGQMAQAVGHSATELSLPPFLIGSLITFGLFISLFLHEVGHLLAAHRSGVAVQSITILILGGMTQLERNTRLPPGVAAKIAIAGPAVNLSIGLLCLVCLSTIDMILDFQLTFSLIGVANLFVGLFNLIPAFPLDGARILEAVLCRLFNRSRAIELTKTVSHVFAAVVFAMGIAKGSLLLVLFSVFLYLGTRARMLMYAQEGDQEKSSTSKDAEHPIRRVIIAHTQTDTASIRDEIREQPDHLIWVHTQSGAPIGLTDHERVMSWNEETLRNISLDSFEKVYFGEPVSTARMRNKDWFILYDEYNLLKGAIKNHETA